MRNMTFVKNIFRVKSKRGSYILEATITLPIFMIGVLLLSSIITIVARCENANFILCDEAEKFMFVPMANLCVEERMHEENAIEEVSCFVSDGRNRTKILSLDANIGPKSFFDINSKVRLKENLIYRPFVGAIRNSLPATNFGVQESRAEIAEFIRTHEHIKSYHAVYIFPNAGKKYHKRNCTYVNSYYSRVKLTPEIQRKYRTCTLCKSKNAKLGDMVYCFEYGDDYHLRNCPTIDKFVIEIDIEDARGKGYTPCSKCGG